MAETTGPKPLPASWTLVLNTIVSVLSIVVAVVVKFTGEPLPEPDGVTVAFLMGLLNILLRFKTKGPVAFRLW